MHGVHHAGIVAAATASTLLSIRQAFAVSNVRSWHRLGLRCVGQWRRCQAPPSLTRARLERPHEDTAHEATASAYTDETARGRGSLLQEGYISSVPNAMAGEVDDKRVAHCRCGVHACHLLTDAW